MKSLLEFIRSAFFWCAAGVLVVSTFLIGCLLKIAVFALGVYVVIYFFFSPKKDISYSDASMMSVQIIRSFAQTKEISNTSIITSPQNWINESEIVKFRLEQKYPAYKKLNEKTKGFVAVNTWMLNRYANEVLPIVDIYNSTLDIKTDISVWDFFEISNNVIDTLDKQGNVASILTTPTYASQTIDSQLRKLYPKLSILNYDTRRLFIAQIYSILKFRHDIQNGFNTQKFQFR